MEAEGEFEHGEEAGPITASHVESQVEGEVEGGGRESEATADSRQQVRGQSRRQQVRRRERLEALAPSPAPSRVQAPRHLYSLQAAEPVVPLLLPIANSCFSHPIHRSTTPLISRPLDRGGSNDFHILALPFSLSSSACLPSSPLRLWMASPPFHAIYNHILSSTTLFSSRS